MSEEAKKIIATIKQGNLPTNTSTNNKGTDSSQRGIDHSTFGLQTLNENAQNPSTKKGK